MMKKYKTINATVPGIVRNTAISLITILILMGCRLSGGKPDGQEQAAPPGENIRRLTIIFGGDVMQHMPQIQAAKKDSIYDYSDTFTFLKPVFDSAGIVILNLETTVSANGRYSGYPLFAAPASLVYELKNSGVTALMLANNHICDKGAGGLRTTVETIEKAGLKYTGAFADSTGYKKNNPLYMEAEGIRLALLNYTYGTNGMPVPKGAVVNTIDTVRIASDLAKIDREQTDHIVIFFHWGEEYRRKPSNAQRKLAEWCHSQGVEFVIGSHPHVLQPVEIRRDSAGNATGLTAWSLGNLVSNQRWRYADGGMLLKVEIIRRDSLRPEFNASYIPVWVHTPYENGRRSYTVLTPSVADTLLSGDPAAKYTYELFLSDSRKLLSADSTVLETR